MIKLQYRMKQERINSSNISKFSINQKDRRAIREGKVKDLIRLLQAGNHFSSPLVVNHKDDRWRLIDGNHRHQAMLECINEDPNFEIVVWMAVYTVSIPQEKAIYSTWNVGTTQSSTDFLKAHFSTVPMGKVMLNTLPTKIYGDKKNISIKTLMGGQICCKKHKRFEGGYSGGKEATVLDFQNITPSDVDYVRDFVDFMEHCFGKFYKGSQFYQTTPLFAFYRVWFDNQHIKSSILERLFIKVFATNAPKWEQWTKSGGRSACQTFYRTAIVTLKGHNQHLKDDEEALETYEQEKQTIDLVKAL